MRLNAGAGRASTGRAPGLEKYGMRTECPTGKAVSGRNRCKKYTLCGRSAATAGQAPQDRPDCVPSAAYSAACFVGYSKPIAFLAARSAISASV
ncbi:hypothetical protein ABIE65_001951 [Constrictibacter sp. MBR-5]|jgi:hypothetical protein